MISIMLRNLNKDHRSKKIQVENQSSDARKYKYTNANIGEA